MTRILVTGIAGQIGSFLGERLVAGGHTVIGIEHRSVPMPGIDLRVQELAADGVDALLDSCGALDAIVHLAGRTSVGESWTAPMATFDANARLTAALAFAAATRKVTLVNASSAEIFGASADVVQTERTPLAPVSPYGVAKAGGHMAVQLTRETMGAKATNLIFFLAESTRRAPNFVVRKITRGLARVKLGRIDHIDLGNTGAIRDFCYADDHARALEMFALGADPGDYIVASGDARTVADVATTCCAVLGLDAAKVIRSDSSLFRTADIPRLVGDASKLRALGWAPSLTFEQLVRAIAEDDLAQARLEET